MLKKVKSVWDNVAISMMALSLIAGFVFHKPLTSAFARVYFNESLRRDIMYCMRNSCNPPNTADGSPYVYHPERGPWRDL